MMAWGMRQAIMFRRLFLCWFAPALSEAVAFAVHLQDVNMEGQAVEARAGEAFRSEGFCPYIERQVAGDDGGFALVSLGEDREKQFGTSFTERHKAQFVNDQQPVFGTLFLVVQQGLRIPCLHQFMRQGAGRGEADADAFLVGGQSQSKSDTGLVPAAGARGDDILMTVHML